MTHLDELAALKALCPAALEEQRLALMTLPTERRALALRRLGPVLALIDPAGGNRSAASLAAEAGCTREQLYKLARRFRDTQSVASLAPFAPIKAKRKSRLDDEIVTLIDTAVAEALTADPLTYGSAIVERVAQAAEARGLKPPSPAAVRRRLDAFRATTVSGAGVVPPRRRNRPKEQPEHFGGVVTVDHTVLDIAVRAAGGSPTRPLATVVIDQWSRAILGADLSLGAPGADTVVRAMVHAQMTYSGADWPPFLRAVPGKPVRLACNLGLGPDWDALAAAMRNAEFILIGSRAQRLPRGDHAKRLLGPRLGKLALMPRYAFRPPEERRPKDVKGAELSLAEAYQLLTSEVRRHNAIWFGKSETMALGIPRSFEGRGNEDLLDKGLRILSSWVPISDLIDRD